MMTRSQVLKKKKELSLKRLEKFIEFLNLDHLEPSPELETIKEAIGTAYVNTVIAYENEIRNGVNLNENNRIH